MNCILKKNLQIKFALPVLIGLLSLLAIVITSCSSDNTTNSDLIQNGTFKEKTCKCVFFGDSITEIWGWSDPNFFKNHSFLNRGTSGETTTDMLSRFERDITECKTEAVVILAGTNDIAQNDGYISNDDIMKNIELMCDRAADLNIKVILCSILPAYQYDWNPSIEPALLIVDMNNRIKAYADRMSYPYVDYYSVLVDERGGLPSIYAADGVHPNLDCYRIMEDIIVDVINNNLE